MACRDIFGKPGEGIHRWRLGGSGGLAAVDVLGTGAAAFFIARAAGAARAPTVFAIFALLVLVAIVAHEAVGVDTRLNAAIFGRAWPAARRSADGKVCAAL